MEKKNEFNISGAGFLSFDPIVLLQDVGKRWLVILLVALVAGVGSYIHTDSSYVPSYRTNTIFVVTSRGSSTTVYSNLTSTSNLASLFTELLNSSIMRKTVMEEMGVSELDARISTSVIPNTNLVTMTVTSGDPRTAFLTAQMLIDHHEKLTYTIVDGIVMEVLQYPSVPMAPTNHADAMGQMKRMGMLAGLAAAATLALLSLLRDVIRSGTEAQAKLDCDYLGEIPHEKKFKTIFSRFSRRKTSILVDNPVTSFRYVETIRKLRRRVEQHMDGGKVVMVTSLLENEGKSTVAVNLALAMAKKHDKVLLIDCDLRKPACHAILDQKKFSAGIKEVLQGKASLTDSIVRYKRTNLDILFGRKGDKNVGDLIASDRMDALLNWAREKYDYVVLDLPPMAAASDAEGMTGLADACILVVRQNVAAAPALNKAIASLENQRAKLLGCVVNNVYSSRLSSSGGYGNYHKYNYYGSYGSKK